MKTATKPIKSMMREIPILYSTPMIKAKLEGRKTQTRRIVKPQPDGRGLRTSNVPFEDWHGREVKCPYGQSGDLLYARETFCRDLEVEGGFLYRATNPEAETEDGDGSPWKPSIHMPKIAARIWDRVVSIRVERVQDISVEDCIAEGIHFDEDSGYFFAGDEVMSGDAQGCYEALWKKINSPESWEANPWVWVVTTENVSLTGKPELLNKQ